MRRNVVGLLLGLVLLAAYSPAPLSADDCDDLARAGGAADAAQAEQRLTAIVQSTSGYSDAQKRAAQSGLSALQTCLAARSAQPPQPQPNPPQPPVPQPNPQPPPNPVQPQPILPTQADTAARPSAPEDRSRVDVPAPLPPVDPIRAVAPPPVAEAVPFCSDARFVASLGAAQQAYIEGSRAAQIVLTQARQDAGLDPRALEQANAAYATALRKTLGDALLQARAQQAPPQGPPGDTRNAQTLSIPSPNVLPELTPAQLEALGNHFAALCKEDTATAPTLQRSTDQPVTPEKPVSVHFKADFDEGMGPSALVRKAGSTEFYGNHGGDAWFGSGDTVRAIRGVLQIDILDWSTFRAYVYISEGSEATFERLPSGTPVIRIRKGSRVFIKDLNECGAALCVIVDTESKGFFPKGTEYSVEFGQDGVVTLTVFEGSVEVRDKQSGAMATVNASQRFAASESVGLDALGLQQRI